MSIKPISLPRWADVLTPNGPGGEDNRAEPPEAKKDIGWNYSEAPPREYENWLKYYIYANLEYIVNELDNFAPHESSPAAMTVTVDAGRIFTGGDIVSNAAQTTGTITAPTTNPRIDRVVADHLTGLISVVTGTEAASPVAPAIPQGKFPVCQVALATSTTSITDSLITDERTNDTLTGGGVVDGIIQLLDTVLVGGAVSKTFSGNLGAMLLGKAGVVMYDDSTNDIIVGNNFYNDGSYKRINAGYASRVVLNASGGIVVSIAATAAADSAITWSDLITINNAGDITVANANDILFSSPATMKLTGTGLEVGANAEELGDGYINGEKGLAAGGSKVISHGMEVVFAGNTYAISETTTPRAIAFKPDGTKLYVLEDTGDIIYQYTLSVPWLISTATYDSVSYDVTAQATLPTGLYFSSDGTKMYVTDDSTNDLFQYTLSTAWNVSTASYDSISLTPTINNLYDVFFSPDGIYLFLSVVSTGNISTILRYTLTTAWDISSLSASGTFSVESQTQIPRGCSFARNGKTMYVLGEDGTSQVYQYNLSTAWDLSTAAYSTISHSVETDDSSPRGLAIGKNDSKLYMVGDISDDIFEYIINVCSIAPF